MNYNKSKRKIYNKLIIPTLLKKGFEVDNIKDNVEILVDNINTSSIDMIIHSFKYNKPLITVQWCSMFNDINSCLSKAITIASLTLTPYAMATNGEDYYIYDFNLNKKTIYNRETLPSKQYFEENHLTSIYFKKDILKETYTFLSWGDEEEPIDTNLIMLNIAVWVLLTTSIVLCFLSKYFLISTFIIIKLMFQEKDEVKKYNPRKRNYLFLKS